MLRICAVLERTASQELLKTCGPHANSSCTSRRRPGPTWKRDLRSDDLLAGQVQDVVWTAASLEVVAVLHRQSGNALSRRRCTTKLLASSPTWLLAS